MQNTQIDTTVVVLIIFLIVGVLMLGAMAAFIFFLFRIALKRREYDAKRGAEMKAVADRIGFRFTPQTELTAVAVLANFEMFEGSPIKIENLMTGKINRRDAAAFDCLYFNVGTTGKGSTTSRQTMVLIKDERLNLPFFYLRPEKALEKVLNFVSRVDIDIEGRPGFSEKYLLYGHPDRSDETAIRHTLKRSVLDFLERQPPFCALANGNFLIAYQSRTLSPPAQVPNWINFASSFTSLF